jgi:pSer/pThr/pTyr-binding forkhead associated (FHA) protein
MDLNSTNGTFVNSHRINDQAVVHNDIIVIGNHHIRFIAPSAPHSNGAD